MTARIVDGWLVIPYAGPELATIEIAVGRGQPGEWRPAFLDYIDGQRVAKIRPATPLPDQPAAWLRISGVPQGAGRISY